MTSALLNSHGTSLNGLPAAVRGGRGRCLSLHVCGAATINKADKQAKRQPREENVGLESKKAFYVDHTCIDCDTCRCCTPRILRHDGLDGVAALDTVRPVHSKDSL